MAPAANGAAFAAGQQTIFLTIAEFGAAGRDLVIAFAEDASGNAVPVAVTGIAPNSNLYIDADGNWPQTVYCPAYLRRYPFYTLRLEDGQSERFLVCVDESALAPASRPLLDAAGKPTEAWVVRERFLRDVDAAQQRTVAFCTRLKELDLLEAFEADLTLHGDKPQRLTGLQRVSEERLNALDGAEIKAMIRAGHLAAAYQHLSSLANFNRLLDRQALARS
ncbi:MAG: SapC family protein [Gammaproteobacteria bacterium]|nr:SapC family protein [Gammaproteobacteria bacterium]